MCIETEVTVVQGVKTLRTAEELVFAAKMLRKLGKEEDARSLEEAWCLGEAIIVGNLFVPRQALRN